MYRRALGKELVSLVYHIELSKAGWVEKTYEKLLEEIFWLAKGGLSLEQAQEQLRTNFGIQCDKELIQRIINKLLANRTLVHLPNGKLKLSEKKISELEKTLSDFERLENHVKQYFTSLIKTTAASPENVWADFLHNVLIPFIQANGAEVFALFEASPAKGPPREIAYIKQFVERYPEEIRKQLSHAIASFFKADNLNVRAYLFRLLHAYLCVQALGLSEHILQTLTQLSKVKPEFVLFTDTNFLLSILELHDNPSNEAAIALLALLPKVTKHVTVKLYVLPHTLRETKHTLIKHREHLASIIWSKNIVEVLGNQQLSGINRKFLELLSQTPGLTPQNFLDPYIENLQTILRSKGVEVFNESIEPYKSKSEVIDDIVEQQEYEKKHKESPKTYEQLEHDMILWHFAHDKRAPSTDSPVQAKYWVVTIDYGLLGFDKHKCEKIGENLPVCIHPSTLLNMLRFWIPRSPELEQALFTSVQLPFLSRELDTETEQITLRILQTLSRFEDVDDLSPDILAEILRDEALRARIKEENDVQKQIELVKEAMVRELERIKSDKQKWEEKAKEQEKTLQQIKYDSEQQIRHLQQKIEELKEALEKERLEREKEKRERFEEHERQKIRRFILTGIICLILAGGLSTWGVATLVNRFVYPNRSFLRQMISTGLLSLSLWITSFSWFAQRKGLHGKSRFVDIVIRSRNWHWLLTLSSIALNELFQSIP